jgi:hypothetical protein
MSRADLMRRQRLIAMPIVALVFSTLGIVLPFVELASPGLFGPGFVNGAFLGILVTVPPVIVLSLVFASVYRAQFPDLSKIAVVLSLVAIVPWIAMVALFAKACSMMQR